MAKIFGQLERAQLEVLGSDPSTGVRGRIYYHTGSNTPRVETNSGYLSVLLAGVQQILNADISAAAAITRSKLASGTANHVITNDGSGVTSSESTLAKVRGGSGQDNSSLTFPSSGTLATLAGVEQITNKDIDGGTASNTLRITVPKNTTTNLNALTRKVGTVVYDTTASQLKYDDGSALVAIGTLTASADSVAAAMTSTGTTSIAGTITAANANTILQKVTTSNATASNAIYDAYTRTFSATDIPQRGHGYTASSGSYSMTSAAGFADVTNLAINVTLTGNRPVVAELIPDPNGIFNSGVWLENSSGTQITGILRLLGNGTTDMGRHYFGITSAGNGANTLSVFQPCGTFRWEGALGAGTWSLKVQAVLSTSAGAGTRTLSVLNCVLRVYEL